jgi:hypothetical protein
VYLESAFAPLVQTLSDLSDEHTEILFCYQKRRKADRRFFALLRKKFSWIDASVSHLFIIIAHPLPPDPDIN